MGPPLNFPETLRQLARHVVFGGNPPHAPHVYGWVVRFERWASDEEKAWLRQAGFAGHGRKWIRPDDSER